jgi:hypothetical protein
MMHVSVPNAPTAALFKVGDIVTYTNDQGCRFTGRTITKCTNSHPVWPGQWRYYYAPTDADWFPVKESSLTLEERAI